MAADDRLTPREREVLALLAAGRTNAEISRELGISFATAKAHVSSILDKLGAESRAEAVAKGARPGRWRNLVALPLLLAGCAAGIAGVFVAVGLVSTDEPDDGSLKVPLEALADGEPHRFELAGFGQSPYGQTYGAWLTLQPDGTVTAFFDRDPHTGCAVPWKRDQEFGDWFRIPTRDTPPSQANYVLHGTGAYRDGCGGWMYAKQDGAKIFGAPARGLDSFPVTTEGESAAVDLRTVVLGLCSEPTYTGCSLPGEPITVGEPPPPAVPDWGRRGR